ncbi:hypothetical protein [Methylobacterium sp. PvR107]|uniref:hypothetical protein n=1 Tax=Methylobacterium sp. PvR107 TaxID=2806597 RepID=UPI001AE2D8F9|nr:hypothetical protein [Methylobacterium sp. PvR107]MBP1180001.1 hypothetical protein [Methylobacterium sp. PvR107]
MAKPFALDLLPGAAGTLPRKPGWHKRALAADRRHKLTTAPQKGDPCADAKAVDYARWLVARDGIKIPDGEAEIRVDWQPTQHGYRPRAVAWYPPARRYHPAARGVAQAAAEPLLRIELPHWDYVAPAVVESVLLEWAAPVVIETTREPEPAEAGALGEHGGELDAPAAYVVEQQAIPAGGEPRDPHPVGAMRGGGAHIEPMALCPTVAMPCKRDCGFRSSCGRPAPAVGMAMSVSAASDEGEKTDMVAADPFTPARTPREAIAGSHPPEAIRGAPVPLSWVHPLIPGRSRPPVVLHAAPVL